MKIILTIFLITISFLVQAQDDLKWIINYYDYTSNYIQKPTKKDTTCINEINEAKKDIENGKIVFCSPVGFLFGMLRFEDELKEVVESYGLEFKIDLISDVEFEGQTQGCYGAYMTNFIENKFGNDFIEKVYYQADSLYIKRVIDKNKIVDCWDCDIAPHMIGEKPDDNYTLTLYADTLNLPIDFNETILMDIDFIIELDSTTNNYHVSNKVLGTKQNEKYYQNLLDYSINELKKIDKWCPGQLKNSNIRTRQNARIYITKRKK